MKKNKKILHDFLKIVMEYFVKVVVLKKLVEIRAYLNEIESYLMEIARLFYLFTFLPLYI